MSSIQQDDSYLWKEVDFCPSMYTLDEEEFEMGWQANKQKEFY